VRTRCEKPVTQWARVKRRSAIGMDATYDTPNDGPKLMTEEASRAARHRPQPFRRFRAATGRAGVDAGYLESIQAELVLLREENARLRFERAQQPDADSMIERLKSLSAAQAFDEDHRDAAWHLVSEALVMREVLIDVCKEIGQTTITLQTRLSELALDLPDRVSPPSGHDRGASLASPTASAQ
jgi:hypothetical protein